MVTYTQDISASKINESAMKAPLDALKAGIAQVREWKENRTLPMLSLPEETADFAIVDEIANSFRSRFSTVLLVGTGGSSLGGQTLVALKENPYVAAKKGAPKIYFLDNVDPHTMDTLLSSIDLKETGCLVISKSGGTAEIMAQTLILIETFSQKLGKEAIASQFVSITEPTSNPLRRLSEHYGIRTFEHDPKVGGRFSVLSVVGLIPAAIAGLDVRALRAGAAEVLNETLAAEQDPKAAAPAIGAALQFAQMQEGRDISIIMPYCDRLAFFGMWFRQLWAESLGKDGKGSTPIRAMGTVDQHSQLQLYLDGPKDKFFTLIAPETAEQGPRINGKMVADEKLGYIRERTIGDVMAAYQHGTVESLKKKNCPVRQIHVPALNEKTLGALLMHFMLETILTAHLMQINAFDQPAVEDSKIFAREYLATLEAA